MIDVEVMIAAYGDSRWRDAAYSHALPSVAKNHRIARVVWESEGTLAGVRNALAVESKRDWLCFLDADDELAPGYFDAMERAIFRYDTDPLRPARLLLAPAVQYVFPDGRETPPAIPNKGRWPELNECVIGTLVPRWLFEDVGKFRELPSLEDYDLWLRCVRAGAEIVHVPDAIYRAHVSARSRNSDQSIAQQLHAEHIALSG